MQVKKFEAPTIKEALEMVKHQLGPEAIILNAKDNSKNFGLMGRKSIEITAAITEKQLLKKQIAESKLRESELEKLRAGPARVQKEFIEKSVQRYMQPQDVEDKKEFVRRNPTQMRYVDIEDDGDENIQPMRKGQTVETLLKDLSSPIAHQTARTFVEPISADQRVKKAAQDAYRAFQGTEVESSSAKKVTTKKIVAPTTSLGEIQSLRNEIQTLKTIIEGFRQIPVPTQIVQAAKSQDIQLHPGADHGISFELSGVYQRLIQSGISEANTVQLIEEARRELKDMGTKASLVEGWIAKKMLSEIQIRPQGEAKRIQCFFGPAGSGKTSHLVKLASYYVIHKNKKVGILSSDTEKVGALDQLRIYAQILNVPFGILSSQSDWKAVVDSLQNLDYVLIDFPGSPLKDLEQIEKLKKVLPQDTVSCDKHLVLAATLKDKEALEITERYRMIKPTDIIFNKLDEAVSHGLIYNYQKQIKLPLFSFGIGANLPEDFEFATKERLIDLIFKISKLKG